MFFIKQLKDSMNNFKKLNILIASAMLVAIYVVLTIATVYVTNVLRVSFTFLPTSVGSALFGPLVGGVIGGMGDIIGYIIRPSGPFFPGYTFNAIVTGLIYGFFLYKRPISVKNVFWATLLNIVIVDLCLSPLWLSILYGKSFVALITARILKSIILLPINTFLAYVVIKKLKLNYKD